jgi:phage-related protein (TIGR01555 family)
VSSAIGELKFDIIKIKGLSAMMETSEGAKKLVDRFANANAAKSVVNSVMLDKEEEWERRELRLTNMDRVLMSYLTIACGAADIPATRLLGRSPDGMNSAGDSDTRNLTKSALLRSAAKLARCPLLSEWIGDYICSI